MPGRFTMNGKLVVDLLRRCS